MRKPLFIALLFVALWIACDTKSATGPSTVVIEAPSPPTTTTSVPPGTTTTVPPTTTVTTTTVAVLTQRTYVAFGPVPPTVPSQLSIVLQAAGARSRPASLLARLPLFDTAQETQVWTVLGFYRTGAGGGGQVSGTLVGTLDEGTFNGTLTFETPECTAEREFGGTLDPQFLRWTGGQTLRDCKGSPLAFNSLVMLATTAPPPTSTAISSSTTTAPVQCAYSLSANGTSLPGQGGSTTVGLTTGPTCGWTVQNFVDWITVQPQSGSGSATIAITVARNDGPPRSATVVIAGNAFVVNQGLPTTTTTTSVLALPDLVPVTPTGSFCRRGSAGTLLYVDVHNQGTAAAAESFTRVYFDNGISSATFVDRVTQGLQPNATAAGLTFAVPPSCIERSCTILITVDVQSAVLESSEGNNNVSATCNF
jgi:CARDB